MMKNTEKSFWCMLIVGALIALAYILAVIGGLA